MKPGPKEFDAAQSSLCLRTAVFDTLYYMAIAGATYQLLHDGPAQWAPFALFGVTLGIVAREMVRFVSHLDLSREGLNESLGERDARRGKMARSLIMPVAVITAMDGTLALTDGIHVLADSSPAQMGLCAIIAGLGIAAEGIVCGLNAQQIAKDWRGLRISERFKNFGHTLSEIFDAPYYASHPADLTSLFGRKDSLPLEY